MGVGPGQSQGQGPLGAVNEFKHNHPRRFVAILVACIVVPLVLLGGSHRGAPFLPSRAYAYPPEVYGTGALAIAPVSPSKAAARSEALWKHNLEKRKDFIREKGGLDRMRMFTEKKEGGWGQLYTVWDMYVPAFPCFWEMERVGRMVDGGKYMCGLPRVAAERGEKCVVYSFGVAQESSWEAEILQRTDCEIYMYDFSVSTYGPQIHSLPASLRRRAHFFAYGVGSKDEEIDGIKFYTLKTLMAMNGHDWIDILKIDVEGAEFWVLPEIVKDFGNNNLPFDQLLLEIHVDQIRPVGYDIKTFDAWWNTLEAAGLRAFAAELNYPALHFTEYAQSIEIGYLNYGNRRRSPARLLVD